MTGDERDPIDIMRDRFRAASIAHARHARRQRRWRPGRLALALVALLGLGGGIAVAGGLISIGEPTSGPDDVTRRNLPASERAVVVEAPDPDRPLRWGVAVYESRAGRPCALAGQVLDGRLGRVRDGRFEPFAPDAPGACGDLTDAPLFLNQIELDGRRLVYGRARPGTATVEVRLPGERNTTRVGRDGAFLFVLDADAPPLSRLVPRDARGRPVS